MPAVLRRLPAAVADIIAAAEWYEDQVPGLGSEFVAEVDQVIRGIGKNPQLYGVRFADVRCARLKRFRQYGIFYYLWKEEVIIFSVFHASRSPKTIRDKRSNPGS